MNISLDFGETVELTPGIKLRLRFPKLTDEQLFDVCARNEIWRFERDANGELTAEIAKGGIDGLRITNLNMQIHEWANNHGERLGVALGSNVGYYLANGAMRAPIASWLSKTQWNSLSREELQGFPRLCPFFVAEMRTLNLRLDELDAKMREYQRCGAQIGVLIDPTERTVFVYRPNREVLILNNPAIISCDPEMPGFSIDAGRLFAHDPEP